MGKLSFCNYFVINNLILPETLAQRLFRNIFVFDSLSLIAPFLNIR